MLKKTAHISLPDAPAGLPVVPDTLCVPVLVTDTAKTPTDAAARLASRVKVIEEKLRGAARIELSEYTSWTEKLAGKSLLGHGARYHAKAKILLRSDFDAEQLFIERVQSLEAIRSALAGLDDGSSVTVGAARWGVSDPERHRDAVTRHVHAQVQASADTFGIGVHEIRGSHALSVDVVGPMSAYIGLDVSVVLQTPDDGARAAS